MNERQRQKGKGNEKWSVVYIAISLLLLDHEAAFSKDLEVMNSL